MTAVVQAYFASFARYNRWANARVYDAASMLSDAQYRADCGAFFRSMHGTLNHLLVTDRIWIQRLTGAGEAPGRLDAILFEDLASLRDARDAEDARIIAYVDGLTDAALAGTIRYRRVTTPEPQEAGLIPTLAHLFNHQTHHRGQAHVILTGLTGQAPELDLLLYQRLVAAAG